MGPELWAIRGVIAFVRVPSVDGSGPLWEWWIEQFQPDSRGNGSWIRLYNGATATLSEAVTAGQAAIADQESRTALAVSQIAAAPLAVREKLDESQRMFVFD